MGRRRGAGGGPLPTPADQAAGDYGNWLVSVYAERKKKRWEAIGQMAKATPQMPQATSQCGSQKENGMHHTQFYRMLAECWVFATGTKDPKLH